jgi:hypothetical protein
MISQQNKDKNDNFETSMTNFIAKWYFKDQIGTFETLRINLVKGLYFKDHLYNLL